MKERSRPDWALENWKRSYVRKLAARDRGGGGVSGVSEGLEARGRVCPADGRERKLGSREEEEEGPVEALELGEGPLALSEGAAPGRRADLGRLAARRSGLAAGDAPAFGLGQAEGEVGRLEREQAERDRRRGRVEVELAPAEERRAWQRAGCEPGAKERAKGEAQPGARWRRVRGASAVAKRGGGG